MKFAFDAHRGRGAREKSISFRSQPVALETVGTAECSGLVTPWKQIALAAADGFYVGHKIGRPVDMCLGINLRAYKRLVHSARAIPELAITGLSTADVYCAILTILTAGSFRRGHRFGGTIRPSKGGGQCTPLDRGLFINVLGKTGN